MDEIDVLRLPEWRTGRLARQLAKQAPEFHLADQLRRRVGLGAVDIGPRPFNERPCADFADNRRHTQIIAIVGTHEPILAAVCAPR